MTSVLKNMDSIKFVLDKMDRFDLMLSKTEIAMLTCLKSISVS